MMRCVLEADGDEYEGDVVDGQASGKGTKTSASGMDGQPSGKGTKMWADGTKYEGDFVDGQPSGKGTKTWANGDKYEGDFVYGQATGQPSGKGTKTWANGYKYEGDGFDGQSSGKGTNMKTMKTIPKKRKKKKKNFKQPFTASGGKKKNPPPLPIVVPYHKKENVSTVQEQQAVKLSWLGDLQDIVPIRVAFAKWYKTVTVERDREREQARIKLKRERERARMHPTPMMLGPTKAEHVAPKAYRLTLPFNGYLRTDVCGDIGRHTVALSDHLLRRLGGKACTADLRSLLTPRQSELVVDLRVKGFTKKETRGAVKTLLHDLVYNEPLKACLEKECSDTRALCVDVICGGGHGHISTVLMESRELRPYLSPI